MTYQHNQNNRITNELESLNDTALLDMMEQIPKILERRKADRIKEFFAETRKQAKEKGFKVSFEKIKSKRKPSVAKVPSSR